MTKNGNSTKKWIEANLWNLLVTFVAIVAAWVLMNARVIALENKVKEYPSQQYFDLRFSVIEKTLSEVKVDLKEHISR